MTVPLSAKETACVALFQKIPLAGSEERRMVQRHSVDCPAKLKMLGGDRDGRLSDLSEAGARFDTTTPPKYGTTGLLSWGSHEFFGKVVWSNDGSCGFVFERPIAHAVVHETVDIIEVESGPVAKFSNIPVAPRGRRAGLVSRGS